MCLLICDFGRNVIKQFLCLVVFFNKMMIVKGLIRYLDLIQLYINYVDLKIKFFLKGNYNYIEQYYNYK